MFRATHHAQVIAQGRRRKATAERLHHNIQKVSRKASKARQQVFHEGI